MLNICQNFKEKSFIELFELIGNSNIRLNLKFEYDINEKINNGNLPLRFELEEINFMKGDCIVDRIRNSFFERCYMFEYIKI